jgi:hypothetical protein
VLIGNIVLVSHHPSSARTMSAAVVVLCSYNKGNYSVRERHSEEHAINE